MKKLSILLFSLIAVVLLISIANVSSAEGVEVETTLQKKITEQMENTNEKADKGGIDRQAILEKAEKTDINKTIQNLRAFSVDSIYIFIIILAIAVVLSIFLSAIRTWVTLAVVLYTVGYIFINYTEDVTAVFISIADKIAGFL